ncbi:hypothetical protein AHiyo1_52240, partial [Arthrobacter sp. Hiyo1]|uniref:hypothetical protein n=1 Tax=Arthrobacter sp. Hiyo1 TaxID=1588020 RepID=UPI0006A3B032
MLGDPVELLACNVVVDLRGTLAVRAVGAAQIRRVGNPGGTLFPGSAAEATSLGTWAIELAGTSLGAVAEATAFSVAFAARTVTERLPITVTVAARTITKRLPITVTETRARIPITTRTVTKRLPLAVTKRLPITLTETRARIPITTRTVTKG